MDDDLVSLLHDLGQFFEVKAIKFGDLIWSFGQALTKGDLELAVATLSLLKLDEKSRIFGDHQGNLPPVDSWWNLSEDRRGFGAL